MNKERYYQICQECGENAFEYKNKPQRGQPMFANDIVGEVMQPGEEITCLQCHRPVPAIDLSIKNLIIEIELAIDEEERRKALIHIENEEGVILRIKGGKAIVSPYDKPKFKLNHKKT